LAILTTDIFQRLEEIEIEQVIRTDTQPCPRCGRDLMRPMICNNITRAKGVSVFVCMLCHIEEQNTVPLPFPFWAFARKLREECRNMMEETECEGGRCSV